MTEALVPMIAGNWKMNGLRADGTALAAAVAGAVSGTWPEVLICPPATLLMPVGAALQGSPVKLGAQDCAVPPSGAFTGDISAPMLRDAGCDYVIVGHSERRTGHREQDADVCAKAEAALAAGLRVIVCVGECEAERDAGRAIEVVARQVRQSVPVRATAETLVVAYEPIWAIGTGRTPTLDDIVAMHADARQALASMLPAGDRVRLLYGGSVKASNAREILALPAVDGALVGGASLKAEEFLAIIAAVPGI